MPRSALKPLGDTDLHAMQHNIALHETSLKQLQQLIKSLDSEQYSARKGSTSSVGMHIRHIIEFYQELLRGAETNERCICYDDRKRCPELETSQLFAIHTLDGIIKQLIGLQFIGETMITLACIDADGDYYHIPSTMLREAYFVYDHTTHHMAIIAMLVRDLGNEMPPQFGIAQSTLRYRTSNS